MSYPDDFDPAQLEFPLTWNYRIIAKNHEGIRALIENALDKFVDSQNLQFGHFSSQGHYITFNIDIQVNSLDQMRQIGFALQAVEGVRMVL